MEKEKAKLEELKAAPDKHRSEIKKLQAKLATLEVRNYHRGVGREGRGEGRGGGERGGGGRISVYLVRIVFWFL